MITILFELVQALLCIQAHFLFSGLILSGVTRIKVGNFVASNQGGEFLFLVIYEVSLPLKFFIKRFDRLFIMSYSHLISARNLAINDGVHDVVGIFLIVAAGSDFDEICALPRIRRNHRCYFL